MSTFFIDLLPSCPFSSSTYFLHVHFLPRPTSFMLFPSTYFLHVHFIPRPTSFLSTFFLDLLPSCPLSSSTYFLHVHFLPRPTSFMSTFFLDLLPSCPLSSFNRQPLISFSRHDHPPSSTHEPHNRMLLARLNSCIALTMDLHILRKLPFSLSLKKPFYITSYTSVSFKFVIINFICLTSLNVPFGQFLCSVGPSSAFSFVPFEIDLFALFFILL